MPANIGILVTGESITVQSERALAQRKEVFYKLLLALCLMVMASFAFPRITWMGNLGYVPWEEALQLSLLHRVGSKNGPFPPDFGISLLLPSQISS